MFGTLAFAIATRYGDSRIISTLGKLTALASVPFSRNSRTWSTTMARAGLNIHNMVNKSRGEMAFTLVDVDSPIHDKVIRDLAAIDGVLSVRSLPAVKEES